ncbi:MAG: hypothetical protein PVI23_08230 [Maricaulaceae bacterium]|jgi:hypothetical protein
MLKSLVQKSLNRRSATAAIALAAAALTTACYPIESDTPAIVEATRLHDLPLTSGLYCWAELSEQEPVEVESFDPEACYDIDVYDGLAELTLMDEEYPATTFKAASLGRGAMLLQHYDPEEDAFALYTMFLREDGLVIVPPARANAVVIEIAGEYAAALKLSASDVEDLLEDDYDGLPELAFAGGAPSDIHAVLREATGLLLDQALRDEETFAYPLDDAIYFVRTEATPEEIHDGVSQEALQAAGPIVASLRGQIGRAMALE